MSNELDSWPGGETATMNVTYTQANAAGGAVVCEITAGAGNEFIILAAKLVNSGTNGGVFDTETAAGGLLIVRHATVVSGAGAAGSVNVGMIGTPPSNINCGLGYPVIISGAQAFKIAQSGAGAQNDTFQVMCNIRVKGAMPTVIHSNSTNPANVSVTAGAESFTVI